MKECALLMTLSILCLCACQTKTDTPTVSYDIELIETNAWLSLYQRTGDELSLAKAKALIDHITILQNANTGMIPTFWRNFFSGEDWINCTLLSIQTLLRMEEME